MSEVEQNKATLVRWFEEVWNQRREAAIDEMMLPHARAHGIDATPIDRDGFHAAWTSLLKMFPDIHVTVDDVVGEGNKTAARHTAVGTHAGQGMGLEATGKQIRFSFHSFTVWEGGLILEGWNVIDTAAIRAQATA
ncbi:MAG TPA: ester cyclase [Fimbriimonadaceae bacterium]|nr:ester cyclase [Fimbriimonadaceae bacterium]